MENVFNFKSTAILFVFVRSHSLFAPKLKCVLSYLQQISEEAGIGMVRDVNFNEMCVALSKNFHLFINCKSKFTRYNNENSWCTTSNGNCL